MQGITFVIRVVHTDTSYSHIVYLLFLFPNLTMFIHG